VRIVVSSVGSELGSVGQIRRYKSHLVTIVPSEDMRLMGLPSGTNGVHRRPSYSKYNFGRHSRLYGVGAWTSNIIIDEHLRVVRQGIPAPNVVPTLTAAGTGLTNTSTLYLRFKDSLGNRVGPLSAPSVPLSLANQSRVSGNIPTTCPDPSVDVIQGLMAVDGATPRVAWERQLGTGNVTESVATLALLDAAPDDFLEMPLGSMTTLFHDVQVVAGNHIYPERAFFSATAELERHEGLYAQTDGEFITGLWCHGDYVFVNSHEKVYRIQGFTASDINRDVEKGDLGVINHDGIVAFHRKVILPTTIGFQLYDGMWHHLMRDRQSEYQRQYKQYRGEYEAAQGYYNPRRNAYIFGPVPHSTISGPVDWVIDAKSLIPEIQSSEFAIRILNDTHVQTETTRAIFYLPQSGQPVQVSGDTTGMLRYEDQYGLDLVVKPATFAPDLGGGLMDGNRFNRLWLHLDRVQEQGYELDVATGPPSIGDPGFVPNDLVTLTREGKPAAGSGLFAIETDAPHTLERCSGEAISIRFRAFDSVFRGYGLTYGPGVKKTSYVTDESDPG
jgi:hypothetical protein